MSARLLLALALVLAACGSDSSTDSESSAPPTPVPTVPGVGALPGTIPTTVVATSTTEPIEVDVAPVIAEELGDLDEVVADQVDGNRLLVIGDSIMASTATRFGREMCDGLNPLGWSVEVDAEPGRFVEFGLRVIDRRLPDEPDPDPDVDWDAAIVHLGSNYGLDEDSYRDAMTKILYQLSPRPILVYTVTEYRPAWAEVNEVIDEMAELFPNVVVVDWEEVARTPGVLSGDGLHPTNAGEEVLVGLAATALGTVDADVEGECLRSSFTDDSAIRRGGGTPNGSSTSSTSSTGGRTTSGTGSTSSSSGSTTGGSTSGSGSTGGSTSGPTTTSPGGTGGSTTRGGTTSGGSTSVPGSTTGGTTGGSTTVPGSTTSGGTTSGGSTDGGSTDGGSTDGGSSDGGSTDGTTGGSATTAPPQTSPPQTSPPQTSPPQTSPPQTSPPQTSPPQTSPPAPATTVSLSSDTGG